MTETPPEMWWPSPESLDDLTVEDVEGGFDLLAFDDTECGQWLTFWNQDEAHIKVFTEEFTAVLTHYANRILEANVKDEDLAERGNSDPVQTENDEPGSQP